MIKPIPSRNRIAKGALAPYLAVLSIALALLISISARAAEQPNILVILSDDVPWNTLGYQGGNAATPNIDSIARGGAELNHFYVQSVCTPTRACLMTGRYPLRTGTMARFNASGGMLADERTLANAMKEAGYWTAIVGKWHLGNWEQAYLPRQRGFDHQYGCYNGVIDYFTRYRGRLYDWHRNDEPIQEDGYVTDLIGNEASRLIEQHPEDKPFFMYVPFTASHGPLQAPEEVIDLYRDHYKDEKGSARDRKPTVDAMVHIMDEAVGRILEAIDERGWTGNTLVVYFNDNGGPQANFPMRGTKGTYYEGGTRVPAAMKWPGKIQAGTFIDEPVSVVDLYPTLINLAGGSLEQPLPIDGLDIWPVVTEGALSPRNEFIWSPQVIRRDGWKLIDQGGLYYPHAKKAQKLDTPSEAQLYHISEDPHEETNLIDQQPEIVASLRQRLAEIKSQIRPAGPVEKIPRDARIYGKEEAQTFQGWDQ